MKGLGIDISEIARFKKIRQSDYQKWSRVFTKPEWQYAFRGKKSAERLAGMFAAKEAAVKASKVAGIGHFLDWELKHDSSGAPELVRLKAGPKLKTFVSISHDQTRAIAIVILL